MHFFVTAEYRFKETLTNFGYSERVGTIRTPDRSHVNDFFIICIQAVFFMLEAIISFLSNFALVAILHVVGSGSFPKPLSAKEEAYQLGLMKNGDKNARNTLIEHNLRLVAHIVKKYGNTPYDCDDLVSIGTIGLIKAIDSYDIGKSTKLSSYASRCIENEILMYFRSRKKNSLDVSLDDTIDTDKDGNALTLIDILADETDIAEQTAVKLNSERASCFLKKLPEREREIITMRFGLGGDDPLTQKEIASLLGISRSYVSRIEKKAVQRLAEMFGEAG